MRLWTITKWTLLAFVAFLAFSVIWVFTPHRSKTDKPLSVKQAGITLTARYGASPEGWDVPLPDKATNVYYANYSHFVAYSYYVRFNAPLEVCLTYAKKLTGQEPPPPRSSEESPFRAYTCGWAKGLPWFGVWNIRNGFEVGGGSSTPRVYVDTDRCIFYYEIMD